jgi:hypothetical protein
MGGRLARGGRTVVTAGTSACHSAVIESRR